jgi:hypothetical protein
MPMRIAIRIGGHGPTATTWQFSNRFEARALNLPSARR